VVVVIAVVVVSAAIVVVEVGERVVKRWDVDFDGTNEERVVHTGHLYTRVGENSRRLGDEAVR
jgi:hypothetical protein